MLQRTRNAETLKILERLRKQGAPTPTTVPLDMTQGVEDAPEQPGPMEEEEDDESPGTSLQDNSIPGMAMTGLKSAKKSLKRRY